MGPIKRREVVYEGWVYYEIGTCVILCQTRPVTAER
jgi:hypothetical protein